MLPRRPVGQRQRPPAFARRVAVDTRHAHAAEQRRAGPGQVRCHRLGEQATEVGAGDDEVAAIGGGGQGIVQHVHESLRAGDVDRRVQRRHAQGIPERADRLRMLTLACQQRLDGDAVEAAPARQSERHAHSRHPQAGGERQRGSHRQPDRKAEAARPAPLEHHLARSHAQRQPLQRCAGVHALDQREHLAVGADHQVLAVVYLQPDAVEVQFGRACAASPCARRLDQGGRLSRSGERLGAGEPGPPAAHHGDPTGRGHRNSLRERDIIGLPPARAGARSSRPSKPTTSCERG